MKTNNNNCSACGHSRVFHQIGTGNGVPIGKEYCDDRHADPCNCGGFVNTADNISDEEIDQLREALGREIYACHAALFDVSDERRRAARARCAELLHARSKENK